MIGDVSGMFWKNQVGGGGGRGHGGRMAMNSSLLNLGAEVSRCTIHDAFVYVENFPQQKCFFFFFLNSSL